MQRPSLGVIFTGHAGYKSDTLRNVFGPPLSDEARAQLFAGTGRAQAIDVDDGWPTDVKERLLRLAEENPLSAKLGEAWVRQHFGRGGITLQQGQPLPWEAQEEEVLEKERINQAVLPDTRG